MSKEKMTIHRSLAELKLIDSKIEKAISIIEPTGVMQIGKPVNNFYKKEDFEADVKSKFQSVQDLIDRKHKIKSAIVKANSVTNVEISGVQMTIADAINFRTVINFKKNLIATLIKKHNAVKSKAIVENEKINTISLENAKIMIGKQGDDKVKATDADVRAIIEPFIKRNEYLLVDPLNVEDLIEKLQKEVDGFELEVDAVLSEINAITILEF